MTTFTSTAAYYEIVENGLIKKLHREITRAMFCDSHPMTSSEITHAIGAVQRDQVSPRLPELARMGVVRRFDRRQCRITGHRCTTWELTGQPPVKPRKKIFLECAHCHGIGKTEIFENPESHK